MSSVIRIFLVLLALYGTLHGAVAQELSALARLDLSRSFIRDARRGGLAIDLHITQAVPYRVFTLDDPRRLVVDFREVNWGGISADALLSGSNASGVRFGVFRPGWSRMVVDLAHPLAVLAAGMVTDPNDGEATVQLRLSVVDAAQFSAKAGTPDAVQWGQPEVAELPNMIPRRSGEGPLVVVLDPGHGGLDPGAEQGGESEADLILTFARELKEVLTRAGGFHVVMTRNEDIFVPLEMRVSIARAAGADVFLSLHADALSAGQAAGATVYTLSESASDAASQTLAERHERSDLLAGVDLADQDDVIAGVLMDLARMKTAPRADKLADQLVIGLREAVGRMHKRPRQSAGFSVLKAPDIPSVLIELGFLSNPKDFENLKSPVWRGWAADGIRKALTHWAASDAAEAQLLRQ
ncbi:N-acetylmuramoyl-L-alanine amidase [Marinosulfonomonas sp. PRT-SC04]|nr:N-acetylmuramoyl-L-alanine amidase [Marinosulfonomonas sp. PRT-SC04]